MFTGVGLIPPASAVNYVPWAIIGFLSQYVIRRRQFPFWAKYNCACIPFACHGPQLSPELQMFYRPRWMRAQL